MRTLAPRIRGTLSDMDTVEVLRGLDEIKDAHGRMINQHTTASTMVGQPFTVSVLIRSRAALPRWTVTVAVSMGRHGAWVRNDSCWTEWGAGRKAVKLQARGRERLLGTHTSLGPHD